jgi:predicted AlkP superfamily pyrophosphatase or phosphodiesterase
VKSTTAIVSALLVLGATPALAQTTEAAAAPERAPLPPSNIAPGRPTLVVTIVIDQFSANLFNQYRSRFTGGLKTLADQGLVYTNGFQSHGVTTTCPGHSTVLTGAHPTHTGIPANEWIDPATGKELYCLAAPRNTIAGGAHSENGLVGSDQLLVTNLPDWVKAQSPESRVFAVSGKDRGAINLAGHHSDGTFWIAGPMLTTYVEPGQNAEARLAPIAAFNAAYKAKLAADPNPAWTFQHDQCRTLRSTSTVGGQTFHADLPPEDANLEDSPYLDETTLDAAIYLLDSQQLGRRGVVDLLGVSLSGTDKIGHGYGTQGPEMCEQLLRMDEALGRFLSRVAATPGAIVVLTADHGGSDFPERMTERGAVAGRYDTTMLPRINAQLKTQFNLTDNPLQSGGTGFIVADKDHKELAEPLRSQIIAAAIPLLNAEPNIVLAVPRDELLRDPMPARNFNPEELTIRERLRLSAVAGRGADILRAYAYNLTSNARIGGSIASHGSPWDYDRRVPIIFWRPGERGEEHFWPLRTVDIAPTLANLVHVPTPDTVDGVCQNLGLYDVPACPVVAAEPEAAR